MEYQEFCNKIRENIGDYLTGYEFEDIMIHEVKKNNGTTRTSLLITRADSNISPNIYLEQFYEEYQNGLKMDHIMKSIVQIYADSMERILVLAVTVRVLVKQDEKGIASALVNHSQTAEFGLNERQLYEHALENSRRMFPVRIEKMKDVIAGLAPEEVVPDFQMYVLSNRNRINGASAMMYAQEELHALAEEKQCGFYILPSSIHEVLLFPDNQGYEPEELQEMVRDVNRCVVSENEFLSDSIYRYDRNSREIKIELQDRQQEKEI